MAQPKLDKSIRKMYNAHPFPNYSKALPQQSDERFRYIFEHFLHIPLSNFQDKIILDAGCGTGENTWSWQRILGINSKIFGLDLSEKSVNIANNRFSKHEFQPDFSVGSLLNISLPDNSVDLVFCSGVLVAVTQPQKAYNELVRVLKPGGHLILILYHRYGRVLHGLKRFLIDLLEREDIDRRVELSGKLFHRSMKKLAKEKQVSFTNVLYDQFGLPCESRYSFGKALQFFKKSNIKYIGSWPPIEWSQLGNSIRFSHNLKKYNDTFVYSILLKLFKPTSTPPLHAPNFFTRLSMEIMWTFVQLQLFSISGQKLIEEKN